MNQIDPFGSSIPTAQVTTLDATGIAPREGPILMKDGRFLQADKCQRWAAGIHSIHFGEAIYLTPTKIWVHYLPSSFLDGAQALEIEPKNALAFLLSEGFDVPPSLAEVSRKLEV